MTGWRVVFDAATAFIEGPKVEARRRIAACGDTAPIWIARRDAWATSVPVARRVLDQLEGRKITVPIEDSAQVELDLSDVEPANVPPERQGALW